MALLHPPYTAWHLAYVAIGAGLVPTLDWLRLTGTLLAFFGGTGIAAHALDEWKGRPLGTGFGDRALLLLAAGGFAMALAIAVAGAVMISPWVLAWAAAGIALACAYTLEWAKRLHSDLGFALAWGAFPVVVGCWAQAETLTLALAPVAVGAALLSLAQRGLSTPARFVRRATVGASVSFELRQGSAAWSREQLLATWERPLQLLAGAVVALAVGLLAARAV
ncbi:MAG: hypothetical protein EXR79_17760 [Myxococcales bacterium]|nr:hypothetical protein [Myxococcales bacterium]